MTRARSSRAAAGVAAALAAALLVSGPARAAAKDPDETKDTPRARKDDKRPKTDKTAAPAAAPDKPPEAPADAPDAALSGNRTLRGHTFPFPILQPQTAFITTHVSIQQGFVIENYPQLPAGTLGRYDLQMTGYTQQLGIGAKITDFFGLFVNGTGQLATGTNVQSIVLGDNAFTFAGEGGPVLRLTRSETSGTQIAVRATAGGGTGRSIAVSTLISHLPTNNVGTALPPANLGNYVLSPSSTWTTGGSFLAAQAFGTSVGLLSSLEVRHINNTISPYGKPSQSVDTNQMALTLAFSFDGAPIGVPFALQPEYQLVAASVGSAAIQIEYLLAMGIYYTGRRNLQVGIGGVLQLAEPPIEGTNASGSPAPSGNPSVFGGEAILRYIW